MNKEKNFVSAVVYMHNDEPVIEKTLTALYTVLKDTFLKFEMICVDDASSDGSVECVRTAAGTFTDTTVSILRMSYFHGLELSMNAGVDLAIGDYVYEIDSAFMDYAPSLLVDLYRKCLTGFDIVSAVPDRKEKLGSRLFYKLFCRCAKTDCEMYTEAFRILSRRAINRVTAIHKTIPYRKAVYANSGLGYAHVMYEPLKDESRKKNNRTPAGYRRNLALDSLILFTDIGYQFSMAMTGLMVLFTLFMVIYTVVVYATGNPVAGWTTTMGLLSVGFFGLFGILTIIIKYLAILVDLSFKKQTYRISSIEKI